MNNVKVGDRVVSIYGVADDSWRGPGTVLEVNSPYTVVSLDNGNTAHLIDGEFELEFLEGDILRIQKGDSAHEGKLVTSWDGLAVAGNSLTYWRKCGYTLSLVRRPVPEIVLPTNQYALVFVNNTTYLKWGDDKWYWTLGSGGVTDEGLRKIIANASDYRVIFEGEAK